MIGLVEEIGPEVFQLLEHILSQSFIAAYESDFDFYMSAVNDLVDSVRNAHTKPGNLWGQVPHIIDALGPLAEATEEMELAQ